MRQFVVVLIAFSLVSLALSWRSPGIFSLIPPKLVIENNKHDTQGLHPARDAVVHIIPPLKLKSNWHAVGSIAVRVSLPRPPRYQWQHPLPPPKISDATKPGTPRIVRNWSVRAECKRSITDPTTSRSLRDGAPRIFPRCFLSQARMSHRACLKGRQLTNRRPHHTYKKTHAYRRAPV